MTAQTVLVTGVHVEELDFGDEVSKLVDTRHLDLLRIAKGVPQRCTDVDQQFHYETRQRELYLQLHQQVKRRYRLLIDLHSGWDDNGPCADIYCHNPDVLDGLRVVLKKASLSERVRLIRIVDQPELPASMTLADGEARTSIPALVWSSDRPVYVGLEVYLPGATDLDEATALAVSLVRNIQRSMDLP